VEKDQFLSLVKNYTSLTKEEARELISMQDHFPYSQVIHHLCSRVAQDFNLDSRERLLHKSAIYATERAVLKVIMSARTVDRPPVERVVVKPETVRQEPKKEVHSAGVQQKNEPVLSGQALRNNLLLELDKLKAVKHKFEQTVEEIEKANASASSAEPKKKIIKTNEGSEPVDGFIDEIKTTKKKFKPEGPKQKEQIEIIENFIKTQPTISKSKLSVPPADSSDLAEKSLANGDNIVSETLVEILLKQGKKDKAIEVLKKLIWKIPQKKAYFAAQIEELKK
jgi:hypothetical protein